MSSQNDLLIEIPSLIITIGMTVLAVNLRGRFGLVNSELGQLPLLDLVNIYINLLLKKKQEQTPFPHLLVVMIDRPVISDQSNPPYA